MKLPEASNSKHFERFQQLAQGAFGTITLALDNRTMKLVAIKSIHKAFIRRSSAGVGASSSLWPCDDYCASSWGFAPVAEQQDEIGIEYSLSPCGFNELTALRLLTPHDNILPLLGYFPEYYGVTTTTPSLALVFPACLIDLDGLISYELHTSQLRCGIPETHVKAILSDILLALHHMHTLRIVHCDINPRNVLLTSKGIFQVADFGLAQPYDDDNDNEKQDFRPTNGLCTLYYRPPELLFNSTTFKPSIDMWSCGVLFAELLNLRPLFPGRGGTLDQLGRIFHIVGTPTTSNWPNAIHLPDFSKANFRHYEPCSLCNVIPRLHNNPALLDLFQHGMIVLDPEKRYSALQCLEHSWFLTSSLAAIPSEIVEYFITSRGFRRRIIDCNDTNDYCDCDDTNEDNADKQQQHCESIRKNSMKCLDEIVRYRKKIHNVNKEGLIKDRQDLNHLFQCHYDHSKLIDKLKQNNT